MCNFPVVLRQPPLKCKSESFISISTILSDFQIYENFHFRLVPDLGFSYTETGLPTESFGYVYQVRTVYECVETGTPNPVSYESAFESTTAYTAPSKPTLSVQAQDTESIQLAVVNSGSYDNIRWLANSKNSFLLCYVLWSKFRRKYLQVIGNSRNFGLHFILLASGSPLHTHTHIHTHHVIFYSNFQCTFHKGIILVISFNTQKYKNGVFTRSKIGHNLSNFNFMVLYFTSFFLDSRL